MRGKLILAVTLILLLVGCGQEAARKYLFCQSCPLLPPYGTRPTTALPIPRLAQWQIEGTLRFRQGEPEWQIRWEVMDRNYDLIVIGAEPYGRWPRLLMAELVAPMLGWLNRPLLIARPVWAAHGTEGDEGHD